MMMAAGAVLLIAAVVLFMKKSKETDADKKAKLAKFFYAALAGAVAVGGFGAYKQYGHMLGGDKSLASTIRSPSFDF